MSEIDFEQFKIIIARSLATDDRFEVCRNGRSFCDGQEIKLDQIAHRFLELMSEAGE